MSEPTAAPQPSRRVPPVVDPAADMSQLLTVTIGETGELEDKGNAFRIAVFHASSFPWDEVFKALLYRDYKVSVTRYKADLFIEATM